MLLSASFIGSTPQTQGIRQISKGTVVFLSPSPVYQTTTESRNAYLTMQPDGKVKGSVRFVLTGTDALRWREFALTNDQDALKEQFTATVQRQMPPGIVVTTDHFLGLTDWQTNFQVVLSVTGTMGTSTGKRVFLPSAFFEATSQPLFALAQRTEPIDLNYPRSVQDSVTYQLPPAFEIESLPKDADFAFPAEYLLSGKIHARG